MNKAIVYFILVFITKVSFSQSITDLAGGVRTSFEITSLDKPMGVTDQCIIRRAEQISGSDTYSTGDGAGYGMYGIGYESLHLEFIAKEPIQTIRKSLFGEIFKKYPKYDFYELVFRGSDSEEIFRTFIKLWRVNIHSDKLGVIDGYLYSIDLKDIPLVIFNSTSKIDISRPILIRKYY